VLQKSRDEKGTADAKKEGNMMIKAHVPITESRSGHSQIKRPNHHPKILLYAKLIQQEQ
jgi:hypothetical protein